MDQSTAPPPPHRALVLSDRRSVGDPPIQTDSTRPPQKSSQGPASRVFCTVIGRNDPSKDLTCPLVPSSGPYVMTHYESRKGPTYTLLSLDIQMDSSPTPPTGLHLSKKSLDGKESILGSFFNTSGRVKNCEHPTTP